jgi:hypothetical protein
MMPLKHFKTVAAVLPKIEILSKYLPHQIFTVPSTK